MMHKAEREILKDFQKTVATWDHEVKFQTQISLKGGPTVLVGTDDELYGLVSRDSPEHDISPKDPDGFLAYKTGFTPKSKPGVIGSFAGGKHGTYTRRKKVRHPGHKGRKFDETIAKLWEPRFKKMAEDAMKRAAEKSGHKL